jgi:uncharacterized membrane protein
VELVLLVLLASIPFLLPVAGWVSARRTRRRVAALEAVVNRQAAEIDALTARLEQLEPQVHTEAPAADAVVAAPGEAPPPDEHAIPPLVAPEVAAEAIPADVDVPPEAPPVLPPRRPRAPAFDWESLIGVKLFAAIAGISLVIAAILFLRYSLDQGWLQPSVRAAIGVTVAVFLLGLSELKSARDYPATVNALSGAATAILFATIFAAHAMWALIGALAAFAFLAIVTAVAVVLSIRRESLFIAVLGLLGGFAAPALLSASLQRPVPTFAYLVLLNMGLAWVAYRKVWPVLTWLTLAFTTAYQWVWVLRFLSESSLPLAMGIFIVFPLVGAVGLTLAASRRDAAGAQASFERTAALSAGVPLLFAAYLASVPAYGAHAALLLGFVLLVDAGLLAIAIARRFPLLHAAGALGTAVVMGVWLGTSYVTGAGLTPALGFTAAFVGFHLAAPAVARLFGRGAPLGSARSAFGAPLLLFVFPALAAVEPATAEPVALFGTLLMLLLVVAWRAVAESSGALFYTASFFSIAAQAVWSAAYLTESRLAAAVGIYLVFALVSIGAPIAARRAGRPYRPVQGGSVVLLGSLVVLAFLSLGPINGYALWALALLLAVLDAGLFVESASAGLPRPAQAGTLVSWGLLWLWWPRAAGSVGVAPSVAVMALLTIVTLAGYAWTSISKPGVADGAASSFRWRDGLYLALGGHLFLFFIAANREWSVPPWPVFAGLAVMTLGTSVTSRVARTPFLHSAGVVGAALVIMSWAGAAGSPAWGPTVVLASASVTAFALVWTKFGGNEAPAAAAIVLFVAEASVLVATATGAPPPLAAQFASHVVNVALILMLTARRGWRVVPVAAVVPAWMAVAEWQANAAVEWRWLLVLAASLYVLFLVYPLALGARTRHSRGPYVAVVLAGAMFFFAGRDAFEAAGLHAAVGAVPLAVAASLGQIIRHLLDLEPAAERDTGRLALVAGAALAFVTVTIPLQFEHQWITVGWALEGAALAWLLRRIPHRGLLYVGAALLAIVFIRLTLNPEILLYEERGATRIVNWYLYSYLICAGAMFAAARWLRGLDSRLVSGLPSAAALLPAAGGILLFLLLNIEIADFYSTGPTISFRFGATLSQDLTYTIGWLAFGMLLLAAGLYGENRPARIAAVALIAATTIKCFLYDLASLEGLYRVASFVGLALSLALVSLALKRYVLSKPATTG